MISNRIWNEILDEKKVNVLKVWKERNKKLKKRKEKTCRDREEV